jgi:hypothetical protein
MATTTLSGNPRPDRWLHALRALSIPGLVLTFGLFGGWLSARGKPQVAAVVVGLVLAAMAVASRRAILWFVVVSAVVVTGAAQLYFPEARLIRYLAPAASLALLLHWVTDQFTHARRTADEPLPPPVTWGLGFAAIALVSAIVNFSEPAVTLMGTKNYFQMWVFFLGVAFLHWGKSFDRQLWRGLLLLALLQLPFVAHQYLVLMPKRYYYMSEGVIPADVIAGTFGAQALGGGANAALAAYQVIVVGLLLAMWKNGVVGMLRTLALAALLLSPLLVNQARVSVLYVLLTFVLVFWRDIARRPGKFLAASLGLAGLVAVLMTAIMLGHPGGALRNWSEVVEKAYAQQTAAVHRDEGGDKLTRWSSLTFWAEQHVRANPVRTLLGHGPGASREPESTTVLEVSKTLAQTRYPGMRIGYTGLSALLWDAGLLGAICVLGMFASAFLMAGRLATHYRRRQDGFHTAMFEGLQAAMAVLALSLAHKDFFVVNLPYQAVVYLLVGFIANSWLLLVRQRDTGYESRHI